jgi:hypothetical protein
VNTSNGNGSPPAGNKASPPSLRSRAMTSFTRYERIPNFHVLAQPFQYPIPPRLLQKTVHAVATESEMPPVPMVAAKGDDDLMNQPQSNNARFFGNSRRTAP